MTLRAPSDAAVRRMALDPQRSFLIQAPAGSGKTELLTDRLLALLATVNRPEEIVAITFTRKAASEMHARVMSKLAAGRGPEPQEAHKKQSWQLARNVLERDAEKGWNLLDYPARLSIRTIDSLCAWLVRSMPWLSALGGLPAVTENASHHYYEAAKATLAMADSEPAVAQLVAHLDVDTRQACELIAQMLASRDQWLPVLGEGSDAGQLFDNLRRAVEADLARAAALMPPGWASALAAPLSAAANVLLSRGEPCDFAALADWKGQRLGTSFEDVPHWRALACAVLTSTGTLRRRLDKRQGFDKGTPHKDAFAQWLAAWEGNEAWVAALAELRYAPVEGYQPDQLAVLGNFVRVLWLAAAQLSLRFAEAREVDFIEVSQRALQALGQIDDPSDLLLSLDASIQHLLVDEFQDTSQSQIDLFCRLTAGWQPGDGRTLFLVGDPMQSIYRFRKAEVGWFLKVQQSGLGELPVTALRLTDNFRSQASLVEWVNRVFKPLFPAQPDPAMGAIPYTDSVAFNPADPDMPGVKVHPIWCPHTQDAHHAVQAAEFITLELVREALDRHADSAHPVAILVRARSHLKEVVRRLTREGIPCRAVELVSLRTRQIVDDIVQLARALSHSADRLAWLAILRSPVCGLRLDTLHRLFGADHQQTIPALILRALQDPATRAELNRSELIRLQHAASVLLDDSNSSGSIPFASWLQQCWTRLGGPQVYPAPADGADAESVFRLIEKIAPYGALDTAELDERIKQLYAEPEAAGHAVEVMTIHKSKGLQFDTVIVLGLHHPSTPDRPPLIRIEQTEGSLLLGPIKRRVADVQDPVSHYLARREKRRAEFETDRLLYVAATRARQQLHLVGEINLDQSGAIKPPSESSLLGRLWPHMTQPAAPSESELDLAGSTRVAGPDSRCLLRIKEESIPPESFTLSSASAGGAWQWSTEHGEDAIMGSVAHAWLERIGKEGLAAWPISRLEQSREILRRQLSRAGLAGESLQAGECAVFETIFATLNSDRGRWLLEAAGAYREWSLLDLSGRVSVIDLAISQEEGWLVVDYKTGLPRPDESRERFIERMKRRYGPQLSRYREHVHALDGRAARSALYFPRADIWIENSC